MLVIILFVVFLIVGFFFTKPQVIKVSAGDQYEVTNEKLNFKGDIKILEVSDSHVTFEYNSQQITMGGKNSRYGSFLVLSDGQLRVVGVDYIRTNASKVLMVYSGDATLKSGTYADNQIVSSKAKTTEFDKK